MKLETKVKLFKVYFVVLMVAAVVAIPWAIGVFIMLDLNPISWHPVARYVWSVMVILGLFLVFIEWNVFEFLRRKEDHIRNHLQRRAQQ